MTMCFRAQFKSKTIAFAANVAAVGAGVGGV